MQRGFKDASATRYIMSFKVCCVRCQITCHPQTHSSERVCQRCAHRLAVQRALCPRRTRGVVSAASNQLFSCSVSPLNLRALTARVAGQLLGARTELHVAPDPQDDWCAPGPLGFERLSSLSMVHRCRHHNLSMRHTLGSALLTPRQALSWPSSRATANRPRWPVRFWSQRCAANAKCSDV